MSSRILCCLVVLLLGLMACVSGAAVRNDVSRGDTLARELLRILAKDQPADNQAEPIVDAQLRGWFSRTVNKVRSVVRASAPLVSAGRTVWQFGRSRGWWKRELGEHRHATKLEVTNFSKYGLATSSISDRDGTDPISKLPDVIKPAFEEVGLVGRESSVVFTVLIPQNEVDIMVVWTVTEDSELSMATGIYGGSGSPPNNQYDDWYQLLDDPSSCHGDAECTTESGRLVNLEHCGEQGMCVTIMGSVNAEGNPVIRLDVVPENLDDMAEAVKEEVDDLYA